MNEEIKLPIKSHYCKTTHTACDCVLQRLKDQDQRIAELEAENKQLRESNEALASNNHILKLGFDELQAKNEHLKRL